MGCVSSKAFKKDLDRDLVATDNGRVSCPHHVVSLTSSTYGLLNLGDAETHKQSKSPSPPNRHEVINAWELMGDLEENIPISTKSPKSGAFARRSPMKLLNHIASPRKSKSSGGKENRGRDGNGQFSPKDGASEISPVNKKYTFTAAKRSFSPLLKGEEQVKKMVSPNRIQRRPRERADTILGSLPEKCPPGGENAVVIYTTTLRGIRKTYEECNKVRSIVEAHDVLVDERDISMDSGLKEELRRLTGDVAVPVVFVRGRVVGGVNEVVKMEEEGQLRVLMEGMERAVVGCDGCGGFRFVMCGRCNGSCKVLDGDDKVKCGLCNENGLVRCTICCC